AGLLLGRAATDAERRGGLPKNSQYQNAIPETDATATRSTFRESPSPGTGSPGTSNRAGGAPTGTICSPGTGSARSGSASSNDRASVPRLVSRRSCGNGPRRDAGELRLAARPPG